MALQAEREALLDVLRDLQQQLMLKQAVVDAFIPPFEVSKVLL